jgi:hypothetical protein
LCAFLKLVLGGIKAAYRLESFKNNGVTSLRGAKRGGNLGAKVYAKKQKAITLYLFSKFIQYFQISSLLPWIASLRSQ